MMTSWGAAIPQQHGREMKGRVAQLSRGRLCGVIRADDDARVFFHARDLDGTKYNDIEVGDIVTFELIDDRVSGPRATRVRAKATQATGTTGRSPSAGA